MADKKTTVDLVVELLNTLQAEDPVACAALVSYKQQVPDSIATSPDFVCQSARGGKANLSVLGLLNSILVKAGEPKVAAIVDDDTTVIGFTKRVLPSTTITPSPPPATP